MLIVGGRVVWLGTGSVWALGMGQGLSLKAPWAFLELVCKHDTLHINLLFCSLLFCCWPWKLFI